MSGSQDGGERLDSPFHQGEIEVQERAGVRQRIDAAGRRGIRGYMPDQHRTFFAQLPFVIVGSVDAAGQPWASILAGKPGFLSSPDPGRLVIDAWPMAADPLAANLEDGGRVGLLGIEPPTRRRNRLNGTVRLSHPTAGFEVVVSQSFGNCPQYIQARALRQDGFRSQRATSVILDHLGTAERAWITASDTFFIATSSGMQAAGAAQGVDVSHRGGRSGFVAVANDGELRVPDFKGNSFFNTIGNLVLVPRAGLLFVDFDTGDTLQLACEASVAWDGPEVAGFAGAERMLTFKVISAVRTVGALPLRWLPPVFSPVLERTGSWSEPRLTSTATSMDNPRG